MADTNNRVWAADTPGARHDPADVRRSNFILSGGVTGMIAAGGGGVGLTPGVPMSARLDPCSVVVRSEYPGRGDESYTFAVKSPVDMPIRVTGSGGGRTDVVAFVVNDPILDQKNIAETDPLGNVVEGSTGLDPNAVDYWYAHVFENVPAAAARDTETFRSWVRDNNIVEGMAVPYAKVVQGANSTGLAGKVRPFFDPVLGRTSKIIVDQPITGSYHVNGRVTSYQTLGPSVPFEVPWWATRARLKATAQGVNVNRDGGGIRNGLISGLSMGQSMRQYSYYETSSSAYARDTFMVWADLAIASSRRGTTQDFRLRATVNQDGARIQMGSGAHMFLEVEFLEDPLAVDNSDPGTD